MENRYLTTLVIMLATLLVIQSGFILYSSNNDLEILREEISNNKQAPIVPLENTDSLQGSTNQPGPVVGAELETYQNPSLGIEIKYPKGSEISEGRGYVSIRFRQDPPQREFWGEEDLDINISSTPAKTGTTIESIWDEQITKAGGYGVKMITINDERGTLRLSGQEPGYTEYYTFLKNNLIYSISVTSGSDKQMGEIIKTIGQSFKFTR